MGWDVTDCSPLIKDSNGLAFLDLCGRDTDVLMEFIQILLQLKEIFKGTIILPETPPTPTGTTAHDPLKVEDMNRHDDISK